MALISILISLFAERFLGSLEAQRRFGWFTALSDWWQARLAGVRRWRGQLVVLAAVILPLLLTAVVYGLLHELWSPFGFLFALLVLLYSLGPRDLEAEVEAFLEARERGDETAACWQAANLLEKSAPEDSRELTDEMVQTMLVAASERLFAVLFWFIFLGPVGALLYRLSWVLARWGAGQEEAVATAAERLHAILAWLPARIAALAYALSGNFVDGMHGWRHEAERWSDGDRGVLLATGLGALGYPMGEAAETETEAVDLAEESRWVRDALSLVRRAVVLWLVVLAVATLSGWAG